MHQLILASQSPRRFQLLQEAGFDFKVDTVKVSETIDENLKVEAALEAVAKAKAQALVELRKYLKEKGILVLSADTEVILGNRVFGKPLDSQMAAQFLRELSGKEHRVITAVCVYDVDKCLFYTDHDTTFVRFKPLTETEILTYVATGEPLDRAGGYAIQGLAKNFVIEWRGSWSNVVGLSLELFERMIKKHGWKLPRRARPGPTSKA